MKNWYKSAPLKGILLVIQHVLVILAAVSFVWLAAYPGITQDILSEKNVENYEESQGFGREVLADSQNALAILMEKEQLETNGKLDENKIVDIRELSDHSTISGENKNGLAYRLGELNDWGIRRENGEIATSEEGGYNSIIVCEKQGGGYQYFYYDEFRELIENGSLSFVEDSETTVTQEDVLEWLRDGSFYKGATGWSSEALIDRNNQIQYRTFWNYDGYWIDEAYAPVGAQNILEVVNNNPEWNGKLQEAFYLLDASIGTIRSDMVNYEEMGNFWTEGNTNLTYLYADTADKTIYTNKEEYKDYGKLEENLQKLTSSGRFALVEPKLADFQSNINGADANEWTHVISEMCGKKDDFVYAVNVDTDFPVQDSYYSQNVLYEEYGPQITGMLVMGILSVIGIIAAFVWLTIVAGRTPEDQGIHLNLLDRIKTELMAVISVGVWVFIIYLITDIYSYSSSYSTVEAYSENSYAAVLNVTASDIVLVSIIALLSCMIFMTAYLSLVRRIKARTLWKNSILKWLVQVFGKVVRHMGEIWRTVLVLAGIAFLNILGIGTASGPVVLLMVIADLAGAVYMVYQAVGRHKIGRGIERIAKGEVDYKIPLEGLKGGQREIAEKINTIGEGLDAAVEASMKNERLKTDLITNVSHDIKTPLTSIINYVDLLKRENFTDPKIRGYLDILEAKAQRLKTLTEDVVEASKVSSGNISLEYMDINLTEMIQQTSGEFEEKFRKRRLTEVLSIPKEPVIIRVDGRRMWRVLENIYNNAAKYAMEGTRIYADLSVSDQTVVFSLKNISEQPLNIRADELTERFIRGDVSRSTEGSGLGLSIAKSLTTMQGGTFDLYLDGDLFKVTITFPEVKKTQG
ncbi:hypothetical protein EUBC25_14540 [Claveliimonas bilis]|uniref:sensor histidine kinase n=1 Tax=Claveliimonas bilis TaxID=3028070 RepID=UPI001E63D6C8|nr:MFS domain-containing histidine kinase [Claveliimonas bilis]BCZ27367.1 hypothetical protein EUBC25_14540 [Claveliimonas bilis]